MRAGALAGRFLDLLLGARLAAIGFPCRHLAGAAGMLAAVHRGHPSIVREL